MCLIQLLVYMVPVVIALVMSDTYWDKLGDFYISRLHLLLRSAVWSGIRLLLSPLHSWWHLPVGTIDDEVGPFFCLLLYRTWHTPCTIALSLSLSPLHLNFFVQSLLGSQLCHSYAPQLREFTKLELVHIVMHWLRAPLCLECLFGQTNKGASSRLTTRFVRQPPLGDPVQRQVQKVSFNSRKNKAHFMLTCLL